ncbi:MAG: SUMF1/EgtB/PvdO family nonheme iron enzyme, partial [Spirochaetales bacterium]|nr:SUMF1/EgtB/PvdO family nonheme iron enzyme [Spirochaetales bacterium]
KQPNNAALALFDMTGNVWEMCWGIYYGDSDLKSHTYQVDSTSYSLTTNDYRVIKGSGYSSTSAKLTSRTQIKAYEIDDDSNVGFRIAQTVSD